MKVIILTGGFGTRLRSVVSDRPKPMALIAGKPFLEHQIRMLKKQGLNDFILAVHYGADQIKSYFGNGRGIGVNITYSDEKLPLGTAGAIKNASKYIDGSFLVLNGDSYTKIDINDFIKFHNTGNSLASISIGRVGDVSNFGDVIVKEDSIVGFSEKKMSGSGLINKGVYLFNKKILDLIEENKESSLELDIFPKLIQMREIRGQMSEGYFIDIGKPETYSQFKKDFLDEIILEENTSTRDAMRKIKENGINIILVVDLNKKLKGVLNERFIHEFLIEGGNIGDSISCSMRQPKEVGSVIDSEDKIESIFASGVRHLPIVDSNGCVQDIKFYSEKIEDENFPMYSGKAPLRISFSGGGTDVPAFFEKYGGVVINSTINKYCYASVKKRADNNIVIDSDKFDEEVVFGIDNIVYNGNMDLIKSIINLMKPDSGMEFYLHNDIPSGRGMGSSATFAVLIARLINQLERNRFSDEEIAKIAFRAEREELKISGGWQDQYASLVGGFNFMEFSKDKNLVYPLRLKEEVVSELESRLLLCYVGQPHQSGDIHIDQSKTLTNEEGSIVQKMNVMKDIALKIRDALLISDFNHIGYLLHDSWMNKRAMSPKISDPYIDKLYEFGRQHGAIGGKLLGAGGGGYMLFYCNPENKNKLKKAIISYGKEVLNFNFEFEGTKTWIVR